MSNTQQPSVARFISISRFAVGIPSGLQAGLIAAAVALTIAATPAISFAQQAAGTRIGFVNSERLLREADAAKAAQQKIEREFARRDKDLQDMSAKLRGMTEKFEKEGAVMPDADRVRRQRDIAELDKDFQRRQREFREDLNQRRNEELAAVLERANQAIRKIAEAEKFDLILQEAVYVGPRLDITDRVIRNLNGGGAN